MTWGNGAALETHLTVRSSSSGSDAQRSDKGWKSEQKWQPKLRMGRVGRLSQRRLKTGGGRDIRIRGGCRSDGRFAGRDRGESPGEVVPRHRNDAGILFATAFVGAAFVGSMRSIVRLMALMLAGATARRLNLAKMVEHATHAERGGDEQSPDGRDVQSKSSHGLDHRGPA
jgi:hypothetical protein